MTIAEFLNARYDEAKDPSEIPHGLGCSYVADGDRFGLLPCDCGIPALWLADIAAKRRVVDYMRRQILDATEYYATDAKEATLSATCANSALRALASVYSDHPDYREEWKP